MALIDMKSDLAKGVGSKQTPQSFQDGHSATTVTGLKTFPTPPRAVSYTHLTLPTILRV